VPVRVAQVYAPAAAVHAGVDLDRRAEWRPAGRHQPLEARVQVVAGDADMRESHISGTGHVLPRGRRDVLKKLDARTLAVERQVHHAHVGAGLRHDRLEIAALLLLVDHHGHPHGVAPEPQRALEAGDRQARVVQAGHRTVLSERDGQAAVHDDSLAGEVGVLG
jgi:hypothetical protein